jgi:glycosyltransferase involved in cell wall biosynthesis
MPIVTIITTFYNASSTIRETIDSVIENDFDDFEFILVDDGSSDESEAIIASYNDKRISLIKPGRIGRAEALNLGLNYAKGEFIAILDADDVCLKMRLELQSKKLIDNSNLALVCCNAELIDIDGKKIGMTRFPVNHEELFECLINLNPFPHSGVMFRRDLAINIGGYNPRCEKSIDYNFYLDLLASGAQFQGNNEPLIKLRISYSSWGKNDNEALQIRYGMIGLISYYQRQNGISGILDTDEKEWQKIKKIFDCWFEKQRFQNKILAKHVLSEIRQQFIHKEFDGILSLVIRLIKADPLFWLYKGVGFNFPSHIKSFLTTLKNKLDSNIKSL